jgi:hypothetical protein
MADRRAKRRAKAIAYLGGRCVDCGADGQFCDFDHVSPATKSFTISDHMSYRWSVLQPELDKCSLRCRPCHVQKTALEYPHTAKALSLLPRGGSQRGTCNKRKGDRTSAEAAYA